MHPRARSLLALLVLVWLPGTATSEEEQKEVLIVEQGRRVSIEYTLTLADGSTADTNVGGDPLQFTLGASEVLPALEEALAGMQVEETREVVLGAEKGYGPVDPAKFERVPADQIPADARHVGAVLVASDGTGRRQQVRVHEVSEEEIVINLNHPLAGETLHFAVKIVTIE